MIFMQLQNTATGLHMIPHVACGRRLDASDSHRFLQKARAGPCMALNLLEAQSRPLDDI